MFPKDYDFSGSFEISFTQQGKQEFYKLFEELCKPNYYEVQLPDNYFDYEEGEE
jgi:hypothetical protein